ncbi:Lipid droplet-associated hydrolase [Camellia lanceoleosa]|nr:Lipid droplet-associated hydrolase [Camellia lanceoleosa]
MRPFEFSLKNGDVREREKAKGGIDLEGWRELVDLVEDGRGVVMVAYAVKLYRSRYISKCTSKVMGLDNFPLISQKTHANFRLCNVSGYTTNLLEIRAEDPSLHVLFIPGNPGVISFYTDFLENLYELLGGTASITAVGHISQTEKNWEHGRLFSLEEQIDHKIDFIRHELQNSEVPIILVGHSIGSYISIEMFRRSPEKVIYCIGLYPFLAVNTESSKQATIKRLATSPILSAAVSSVVGLLGLLPTKASRFLVTKSVGKSWSTTAVDALCTHVLQISKNVLMLFPLAIEREGHSHAFSCTQSCSRYGLLSTLQA